MTITHNGITWPRTMLDGSLRPFLADLMRGWDEARRLVEEEGLDLDLDQLRHVDLAVLGATLPLARARDLDQDLDPNPALVTAPEESVRTAPEDFDNEYKHDNGAGQGWS
jgi:hypothetical protein